METTSRDHELLHCQVPLTFPFGFINAFILLKYTASIRMLSEQTLRTTSLVALTFQTTGYVLIARRSRQPDETGNLYMPSTNVLVMELTKLIISVAAVFYKSAKSDNRSTSAGEKADNAERSAFKSIWNKDALLLLVPAACYVAQNNLQLVASSTLEPTLYQVFSQMKLITTALFSVLMLKRDLNRSQWLAILLLGVGVVAVKESSERDAASSSFQVLANASTGPLMIGFLSMLGASLLSGFAGVYTEKLLKGGSDFWPTNAQMAGFSLAPALTFVAFDLYNAKTLNAFAHFGGWAWGTALFNALGGLLVSLVIKYADNILKGFSLACAVILTIVFNVVFVHAAFSTTSLVGTMVVVGSVLLYNSSSTRQKKDVSYRALPQSPGSSIDERAYWLDAGKQSGLTKQESA